MATPKKRKKSHRSKSRTPFQSSRMSLIEVHELIEPLETFMDQVRNNSVWINDTTGDILIDLPNNGVEDLVKKGEEPNLAMPKFLLMFETYFQVVAYCFDVQKAEKAYADTVYVKNNILLKLQNNIPIERKDIAFADDLLCEIRKLFMSVPREKINRVKNEISKAIFNSEDDTIHSGDLRRWLAEEKNITFIIKED